LLERKHPEILLKAFARQKTKDSATVRREGLDDGWRGGIWKSKQETKKFGKTEVANAEQSTVAFL